MIFIIVFWDFVVVIMNVGYQIELVGGGYYNVKIMIVVIYKIEQVIFVGCGIIVNFIYVNFCVMGW